ncbi:UPF0488 protein C8orf33 homolog [Pristis pectinata]|uniref:UPF0488 protein C8orf33 homolog n=1 Tax=Pristis pectinata TaxID=685728 RepID=UPI00223C8DC9|nr:UPF0488 protein C8orf33 homolog [Pristis pectinata]XP_051877585.1 UPF0488 protein C8orf33 homolog [Pristis pectinata]
MEGAPEETVQEELDTGVWQLQTGVCQLMVTGQALNPNPAEHRPNSGSCSQAQCSFQFNFKVPEEGSDGSPGTHPAHGCLNSNPIDSNTPQQSDSLHGTGEEQQIFKGAVSQEPEFKFNFAISEADADVNHTGQSKVDPTQSERNVESTASKPSQKKKKGRTQNSKPPAGLPKDQKKLSQNSPGEERNSTGPTEAHCLSPEQQLQKEVDWCVEQLELGLRSQKTHQKQADRALRAIRTLRSENAPLVKKRQLMRSIFGDYRKKMEEERQRQIRLMLAATKSATIKPIEGQTRSKVFWKTANKLPKIEASPAPNPVSPERFTVDTGDQSQFRFNFF